MRLRSTTPTTMPTSNLFAPNQPSTPTKPLPSSPTPTTTAPMPTATPPTCPPKLAKRWLRMRSQEEIHRRSSSQMRRDRRDYRTSKFNSIFNLYFLEYLYKYILKELDTEDSVTLAGAIQKKLSEDFKSENVAVSCAPTKGFTLIPLEGKKACAAGNDKNTCVVFH